MYKYIIKHYLLKNIVKLEKGIITDFETCNLRTFTKKNKQTNKKENKQSYYSYKNKYYRKSLHSTSKGRNQLF